MTTVYEWPAVRLVYDPVAETVVTHYPGGHWSGGGVVPEDEEHAWDLGLRTPLAHRLHHELAHHLVGRARKLPASELNGCRIVFRDAHHIPQQFPQASTDEWMITAVQYAARGRMMRDADDYGALLDLHRAGVDLPALYRLLTWCMDAAELGVHAVYLAS